MTNQERASRFLLRITGGVDDHDDGDVLAALLDEAESRGAERERAAVVAWLRCAAEGQHETRAFPAAANYIESGGHVRKEQR